MSYKVAICGIDGAGKSELVDKLYEHYSQLGIEVEKAKVDFRCKNVCGEAQALDDPRIMRVGMAFDFVNYYKHINQNYQLLLCDRYDLCYRVLNYIDLDDDKLIESLNKIYDSIEEADLYIMLGLPVEVASNRLDNRGNRQNNESIDVLKKMSFYYEQEINRKRNYVLLDAKKLPDEVLRLAIVQINKLMGI